MRGNARCDDEVAESLALENGSGIFGTEDYSIHYEISVPQLKFLCLDFNYHSQPSAFCTPQWSAR